LFVSFRDNLALGSAGSLVGLMVTSKRTYAKGPLLGLLPPVPSPPQREPKTHYRKLTRMKKWRVLSQKKGQDKTPENE